MLLLLILIPMLIGIWAQMKINSAYSRWSKVPSRRGISGAQAARDILRAAGINDVEIVQVRGKLTDHYNPSTKKLALSSRNYEKTNLAALGVAAHEAGHAIQHRQDYLPLKFRSALVPITSFSSKLLPFVILGGLFFGMMGLIKLGVIVYLILTVFQLLTLPVEFDASRRARAALAGSGIISESEMDGVGKTLNAAGFTYVAAFIASLSNLLFFFLLSRD